jgi:aminoglycoside phosphotransferase
VAKVEPSWQEGIPTQLRAMLDNHSWRAVTIGRSGMHVMHIENAYLKVAHRRQGRGDKLLAEKVRLEWLKGKLPVPQVLYYGNNAFYEYLFISEIAGVMAMDPLVSENMSELIHLLAEGLHTVHAIDRSDCPFKRPIQPRLEVIRTSITAGRIDAEKFKSKHDGMSPQLWYEQLEHLRPAFDDMVFAHGDFCLPNIVIDPEEMCIRGFIDWEQGAIADRYEDLNMLCWSLSYNFDDSWVSTLLGEYGLEYVDREKLTFYKMLEEGLVASGYYASENASKEGDRS